MPTQPSLLAACWTSAGNAVTFRGLTTSPVDIRTRIEAVAEAGYTGFGLTREDLVVARETVGLSAVATMLADNGIETVQLEWITNWWTAGETRRASDEVRHDLFDACPVLGVDNIKVGADDDGVPVSYDQLCHGFDVLATDAARVGVKIGFENTPFSHHVKTTEQAIRFITDVANPNGGLVVDIWHAQRGGTPYADIPRLLPLRYVVGVELDDGHPVTQGPDLADTFDNRLVCGTGAFDVVSFVRAIDDLGWTGPYGIEHMSVESRRQPIDVTPREARDGALACLAAARQSGPSAVGS
jgi:sugar phosphate isomerase/epimerase